MGYPNAYDRSWNRTGAELMIHGDCSSRGCYAMTDEQISEIYALARDSFFGGQRAFQVQAFPFRMTAENMARHRKNPHMDFWKMLKQGYDHFEVTKLEPKVDVCEKRYVFNAQASGGTQPINFSPRGKCPVYEVPQEIASAVYSKQRNDELQFAQLASRGTPVAPVRSGRDGGMHPTFVAKLQPREIVDERGNVKLVVDRNNQGNMVAYSSTQPAETDITSSARAVEPVRTASVPLPRTAPQAQAVERAAAEPSFGEKLGNFFRTGSTKPEPAPAQVAAVEEPKPAPKRESMKSRVSKMVGLRGSNTPAAQAPASSQTTTASDAPNVKTAQAPAAATAPAPSGATMSGAQPAPSSTNFDNRWSAFR
jgi:hypothetical protein